MSTVEEDRLRRQLRAMGAVNRHLQAQLEGTGAKPAARPSTAAPAPGGGGGGGVGGLPARRSGVAGAWVDALADNLEADELSLVRGPDGSLSVVEGSMRREVRSGLIAAAIEEAFGAARAVSDDTLGQWIEGPPVEVLEGPSGAPFVILGGQRHPLRGLPLPHPVAADDVARFPEGDELNVAKANVARTRFVQSQSGGYQIDRAKRAIRREGGVVKATTKYGKRAASKAKRKLAR